MFRRIRSVVAVALSLQAAGGCSYPIQRPVNPMKVEEYVGKKIVGATKADGKEVLFDPVGAVQGDSPIGSSGGKSTAIALADVDEVLVEEMYRDSILTAMVVFVVVAGLGLIAMGVAAGAAGASSN